MRRLLPAAVVLLAATTACSGSGASHPGSSYEVVVAVPRQTLPWVADFMQHGAELAAAQAPASARVRVRTLTADTAAETVTAARTAAADGAIALITDGTASDAVGAVTEPAHVPVFVVHDGGASAVDPATLPHVYRLAPANVPMTRHLADYISAHSPKVAIIADADPYGVDGVTGLTAAFQRDEIPVAASTQVPVGSDPTPALLAARRAGADTVVVWGASALIAATITSVHQAGWSPAIYTGPDGEDPLVRQQLAAHPTWLDGVTFVSGRVTSEQGPKPYEAFRAAYEKRFGVEELGVGSVVVPPTWAQYPFDVVRLVTQAVQDGGGAGARLLTALDTTVVVGANGDERGFTDGNREGVIGDDICFERYASLRWAPVTDDVLLQGLPTVPQG